MDIVERLRNEPDWTLAQYWEAQADMWHQNYKEAINEIERLRELLNADNQTLRLHFGELTLNEMRIIKSAFQWVLIRAKLKEGE